MGELAAELANFDRREQPGGMFVEFEDGVLRERECDDMQQEEELKYEDYSHNTINDSMITSYHAESSEFVHKERGMPTKKSTSHFADDVVSNPSKMAMLSLSLK